MIDSSMQSRVDSLSSMLSKPSHEVEVSAGHGIFRDGILLKVFRNESPDTIVRESIGKELVVVQLDSKDIREQKQDLRLVVISGWDGFIGFKVSTDFDDLAFGLACRNGQRKTLDEDEICPENFLYLHARRLQFNAMISATLQMHHARQCFLPETHLEQSWGC